MLCASLVVFYLPAQSILICYSSTTTSVDIVFARAATHDCLGRVSGCCRLSIFSHTEFVHSLCYLLVAISQLLFNTVEIGLSMQTSRVYESAVCIINGISGASIESLTFRSLRLAYRSLKLCNRLINLRLCGCRVYYFTYIK